MKLCDILVLRILTFITCLLCHGDRQLDPSEFFSLRFSSLCHDGHSGTLSLRAGATVLVVLLRTEMYPCVDRRGGYLIGESTSTSEHIARGVRSVNNRRDLSQAPLIEI